MGSAAYSVIGGKRDERVFVPFGTEDERFWGTPQFLGVHCTWAWAERAPVRRYFEPFFGFATGDIWTP
jgi:hypothetical protein